MLHPYRPMIRAEVQSKNLQENTAETGVQLWAGDVAGVWVERWPNRAGSCSSLDVRNVSPLNHEADIPSRLLRLLAQEAPQ
jgi:hypothetical protein